MSSETTYPVQVLREHTTALEAALSVCLAEPGHKPVHKLRTETRRVEAELLLLSKLPEIPEHRDEADVLLKELKKLRRAAGEVRDFDVHRKLLDKYADVEQPPALDASQNGSGPEKAAKRGARKTSTREGAGTLNGADGAGPAVSPLQKGAGALRDHLGKKRDDAAADLLKLLKKRQARAAVAAEDLLKVLRAAEDLPIPVETLLQHAQALLERDHLLERESVEALDEDALHSVRKAAKAARYLAETAPESQASVTAAEHFESLQEAGGQWHDLLELARASKRFLGKSHELTVTLLAERDRKLGLYREALAGDVKPAAVKKSGKKNAAKLAGKPRAGAGEKRGSRKASSSPARAARSAGAKSQRRAAR